MKYTIYIKSSIFLITKLQIKTLKNEWEKLIMLLMPLSPSFSP